MRKLALSGKTLSLIFEFASVSALIPVIQIRLLEFGGDEQMQLMAFAAYATVALICSALIAKACDKYGAHSCAKYLSIISLIASVLACFAANQYLFLIAIGVKGVAVSREVVSLLESARLEDTKASRSGAAETAMAKALGFTFGPILTVIGYLCLGTEQSSLPYALPLSLCLSVLSVLTLFIFNNKQPYLVVSANLASAQTSKTDAIAINSLAVTFAVFFIAFFAGIASGTLYSYLPYASIHVYSVTEPLLSGAFATLGIVLVIAITIVRRLSSRVQDVSNMGKLSVVFTIIGLLLIVKTSNYFALIMLASFSYAGVVVITLSLSMKLAVQTTENQNNYNFGARSAGYLAGQGGGSIITAVILPDFGVTVLFTIVALCLLSIWPIFSYMSLNTTEDLVKIAG